MFWNQEYAPSLGGVEIFTRNLASEFLSSGHKVCVVAAHSREDLPKHELIEGVPVYRFPFYQALAARDLDQIVALQKQVSALKREFAPDLVHVNFSDASPFFHLRTQQECERSIVVFHSPLDETPGGIQLAATLGAKASMVVAPSEFMKDHLVEHLRISPTHIRVIHNSAREDVFLRPRRESIKAEATFLFAARLVPAKGGAVLLDAAKILQGRGKPIKIRIAGAGPEKKNLSNQASALGINENIRFEGALSQAQLADTMQECVAVVIPSIFQEPAPLISIEAALVGMPVIASYIGGLVHIVEDGKTGLLFEPGNPLALAETVDHLLGDPLLQKSMGEAARARALQLFTLGEMSRNYEKLYRDLFK